MRAIPILIVSTLGLLAGIAPAQAQYSDFLSVTCGANCVDPIGEQFDSKQNWEALQTMGTTDFVGSSLDGMTIDAGSLLAAARMVGATELDRWLRTGGASSEGIVSQIMAAFTSGNGLNVGRVVGNSFSTSSIEGETSIPTLDLASFSATADGRGVGGGGSGYCDSTIDSAQNAAAQNYVNNVMEAAYSEEYGFSQTGGVSAGSNSHSDTGLFGGSCLDIFMQGDKDTLFRPPQLSQLLTSLTQMFGSGTTGGIGGSSTPAGNCANAPTVYQQVQNSMPNAAFTPGNGGFFPTSEYGGGEGSGSGLNFSNHFGVDPSVFGVQQTNSNIAGLF